MSVAPQVGEMSAGETRNFSVDFSGKLDSGELLTGTPTIVQLSKSVEAASDLTLSSKVVSTAALEINGATVALGKAVQFAVAADSTAAGKYTIKITVSTDASPAQTLVDTLNVRIA